MALWNEFFERNGGDGSVGVVSLKGGVGDERADVLLKLGQILHDVVFSEDEAFIIAHFSCNTQVETTTLEHLNHHLDVLLNFTKCALDRLALSQTRIAS